MLGKSGRMDLPWQIIVDRGMLAFHMPRQVLDVTKLSGTFTITPRADDRDLCVIHSDHVI
ncbi:hypothetical protein DPMN_031266 [Dreissena polymorpha]|uniref:Uncharacterized protein n=1 Tax=Dreissena polymorpha TaxID=45954 RepID=A0A9D4RGY3_DREPO|nr:hypothetical protein DPMN_031266 [Dreissena polymorpha]